MTTGPKVVNVPNVRDDIPGVPMPAATARVRQAEVTHSAPDLRIVSDKRKRNGKAKRKPELDAMTAQYAVCRVMQHQWHHHGRVNASDGFDKAYTLIGWKSVCTQCSAMKVTWLTTRGARAGKPDYFYPTGYSRETRNGDDVLTREDWRDAFMATLDL